MGKQTQLVPLTDRKGNKIKAGDLCMYNNKEHGLVPTLVQYIAGASIIHYPLIHKNPMGFKSHFLLIHFNKTKLLKISEEDLTKTEKRYLKILLKNDKIIYGNTTD